MRQLLLLLCLSISCLAASSPDWWLEAGGINIKDKETFDTLLSGDGMTKFIVVYFYQETCPHCEAFTPEWNQLVNELIPKHNDELIFTLVDKTNNWKVKT